MIGTDKGRGVAPIGPAQAVAAMAADVEKGVHVPLGVAHHEDWVLAHVGTQEVARLGDLALMAEKEPAASKDLLELLGVDVGLNEDASADQAALDIHQPLDVRHHAPPPCVLSVRERGRTGLSPTTLRNRAASCAGTIRGPRRSWSPSSPA